LLGFVLAGRFAAGWDWRAINALKLGKERLPAKIIFLVVFIGHKGRRICLGCLSKARENCFSQMGSNLRWDMLDETST
jgi:hypothetical protein